jgi:hypothetical protein
VGYLAHRDHGTNSREYIMIPREAMEERPVHNLSCLPATNNDLNQALTGGAVFFGKLGIKPSHRFLRFKSLSPFTILEHT